MKTTKKKLTKAQNGKNVLRAGRVKKAVAESQAGINRTGWKGFKNQAKIDNIDDQPEMHPGTLDKNVLKTTGKKSPIYYDPKKSSYKQGGTVKKLTKAQKGITVSNPKDSRLQAYKDSTALHNWGENKTAAINQKKKITEEKSLPANANWEKSGAKAAYARLSAKNAAPKPDIQKFPKSYYDRTTQGDAGTAKFPKPKVKVTYKPSSSKTSGSSSVSNKISGAPSAGPKNKSIPKAQNGGIMGFGSLGKTKNTLSQKDMDKMRKEGAAQAKRNKEANKKFNADIKSGKIKLAGVSKNKK
jgi:hypothetical protein